jgi:hypothetical protein
MTAELRKRLNVDVENRHAIIIIFFLKSMHNLAQLTGSHP